MCIETQIDFLGIYVKISAVKIGDIKVHGNSKRKYENQHHNQPQRNKALSAVLKGPLKALKSVRISAALKF
jgi:hypothetical protein